MVSGLFGQPIQVLALLLGRRDQALRFPAVPIA